MKKMLTLINNCTVYEKMSRNSKTIAELRRGAIFEYKTKKKLNYRIWYKIVLEDGTFGYIEATHGFAWDTGIVLNNDAFMIPEGGDFSSRTKLSFLSLVRLRQPITRKDSSYEIQSRQGINGIVESKANIKELDLFIFNIFHTLLFIGAFLFILWNTGFSRLSVLIALFIAGVTAIGVVLGSMLLIFIIRYLINEIRMKA